MTRKLLLLFATVLAAVLLLAGPALAPAHASAPPARHAPVVKTNAYIPFLCLGGLPIHGTGAACLGF
jgi:hypothetical protein